MKIIILAVLLTFNCGLNSNAQKSSSADSLKSPKVTAPGSKLAKKKITKNKKNLLLGQSTGRNVAVYKEGYTAFPGGLYVIKDYIVKGSVNLVCVTFGISSASGYANSGDSAKKYYLNIQNDHRLYREVPISRVKSSMSDMSKAILLDWFGKDEVVKSKIMSLKLVTSKQLKLIVKLYNSRTSQ